MIMSRVAVLCALLCALCWSGAVLGAPTSGGARRLNQAAGPTGPTGPPGPKGVKGTAGARGATGPSGPQGAEGKGGEIGPTGPQGAEGKGGEIGPPGPEGKGGPAGAPGPRGRAGHTGPQGTAGQGLGPSSAIYSTCTYTYDAEAGEFVAPDQPDDGSSDGSSCTIDGSFALTDAVCADGPEVMVLETNCYGADTDSLRSFSTSKGGIFCMYKTPDPAERSEFTIAASAKCVSTAGASSTTLKKGVPAVVSGSSRSVDHVRTAMIKGKPLIPKPGPSGR